MQEIDLKQLHSNTVDVINIDEDFIIPENYYQKSDIKDLKKVSAKGYIKRKTDDLDYIELDVLGTMIIEDSISLKEVEYPFSFKIEGILQEIYENSVNSLDILELLWENIVLEVPLSFSKEEDLSKFHGNGWRLVSEDDMISENNPFNEILKDIEKE